MDMHVLQGPDRILTRPDLMKDPSLAAYEVAGGYQGLRRALFDLTPSEVIAEIRASGLRGRGGSGFPTAMKWEKVAQHRVRERHVVGNGSEGEPGSHKDHFLISRSPHQIIEGMIIASYAVGASRAHLFVKESFPHGIRVLEDAKRDAVKAKLLGDNILGTPFSLDFDIFVGPAAYIAGEETALLEALEGRMPRPRPKPPYYPTEMGLYNKPTVVNNVETFAHVAQILAHDSAWFKSRGTTKSPGTMIFSVSGSVKRPVVVELPLGFPLRTLLEEYAGGPLPGESFQGFFTGGPSFGILPAREIDTPLEYESLRAKGAGLGSAGIIVLGSEDCPVATSREFALFYEKGSCGQCPPCRLGTASIRELLEIVESGSGSKATLDRIQKTAEMIKGRGNCGLITASAYTVQTVISHFPGIFENHFRGNPCPNQGRVPRYVYDNFVEG